MVVESSEVENQKKYNPFPDLITGCGCLIFAACIIFMIVSWGWHIHWLFGVLLLIFILGIR